MSMALTARTVAITGKRFEAGATLIEVKFSAPISFLLSGARHLMAKGRAHAGCTQGTASIKLSVSASACYEDAGRLDTHYDWI